MKVLIAAGLSLVIASTVDAQAVNRPTKLRAAQQVKSDRRFLEVVEDMSMPSVETSEMSIPIVETPSPTSSPTSSPTQEEWQSYQLSDSSVLNYKVNESEGTLSAEVIYDGESWLAIGFSEDGGMVGSEAVIGTPDDGVVQKYDLVSKWPFMATQAMSESKQTLTNTSIEIVDGQTILKFTKLMKEDGEIELLVNDENTLLYAYGSSTRIGYHAGRGSFDLLL